MGRMNRVYTFSLKTPVELDRLLSDADSILTPGVNEVIDTEQC